MESFRALAAAVHRGAESARPHVGLYQSWYGLLGAADAVWCSFGDHTHSTRQGLAAEASLFTDRYHCDATAIEDSVLRVAPLRRIRAALKVEGTSARGPFEDTGAHGRVLLKSVNIPPQSSIRSAFFHGVLASNSKRRARSCETCFQCVSPPTGGASRVLAERWSSRIRFAAQGATPWGPSGINHVSKRVTRAPMHATTVRARVW